MKKRRITLDLSTKEYCLSKIKLLYIVVQNVHIFVLHTVRQIFWRSVNVCRNYSRTKMWTFSDHGV